MTSLTRTLELLQKNEGVPGVTREQQAAVLSSIPDKTTTSEARGPRGGDLLKHHPERRRASLNAQVSESGLPTLHRFDTVEKAEPGIKNEQPWHRLAAFMLLSGRTNSEIAMAAGCGIAAVNLLRTQRWFQELLAVLANEHGQDLQAAITSHAHDAINRIAEIANGDIETYGVRNILSASQLLLEQAKGKATQTVVSTVSHTTHASPSEEMESIQQQLAALRSSSTKEAPLALSQ
jgi:hypothetical protein